ncbi:MAG: hypothetical protein M3279_04665 [Actinomycetota bacterium]|nr:hypothetical protein [Actinomycetota bacterium]
MNTQPTPADAAGTQYEEVPARSGAGGWLFVLLHLALGGVTLALAVDEDFAQDKATFAQDEWRAVFGLVGAALVLLALRAIVRTLRAETRSLTPDLHRRAQVRGRILIAVGVAFFAMAVVGPISDETVSFEGWAKPFYVAGAAYLVLMGLVFQWNPTKTIRQQRVRTGRGRPGVATILRASDTGSSVNDQPQVRIDFELEVGGQTYEVNDKIVMERAKLALLIPGATVNVLVDRVDPNVFHIDWETWKAP